MAPQFPEQLETQRLVLRRYLPNDAEALLTLVGANLDLLRREFVQLAGLASKVESQSFITEKSDQWTTARTFCFGIWHKSTGELIGQLQVKNVTWEIPSAELGYFIGTAWHRLGYATESVQQILRVAFEQLSFERIFVRILPGNRESFALAKKLGFREEGVQRKAFRCGYGDLHDVQILAMVKQDWLNTLTKPTSTG
jgi:RimJ/RimL family protein N-acetyltransferase